MNHRRVETPLSSPVSDGHAGRAELLTRSEKTLSEAFRMRDSGGSHVPCHLLRETVRDISQLNVKRQAKFETNYEMGERLRATRKTLGLNQTEMAALGGVTLNTQSRYESGGYPSLEYLLKIQEAGGDWFWIVTGKHAEKEPLDSRAAQMVQIFTTLPELIQDLFLDQVQVAADRMTRTHWEIISAAPPAETSQPSAIHDKSQDYRHG